MKQIFTLLLALSTTSLFAQNSLSGTIYKHNLSSPVEDASVSFAGASLTTEADGTFSFTTSVNNGTLTAQKTADYSVDIDLLDVIAIRQYVLAQTELNNYQVWCADANGNGLVTTADLVLIKRLLLGINSPSVLPENLTFVPHSPSAQTVETLPLEVDFLSLGSSVNQDLIALKKGDVIVEGATDFNSTPQVFFTQEGCGEMISFYLNSTEDEGLVGLQTTLGWNPEKLSFLSAEGLINDMTPSAYSLDETLEGKMSIAYFEQVSSNNGLEETEAILRLDFEVVGDLSGEMLIFEDELYPALMVTENLEYADPTFTPLSLSNSTALNVEAEVQNITSDVSEGSITIEVLSGTAPFSYEWEDGSTEAERTGLAAGTYELTVTDAAGCSESLSITIESTTGINDLPEEQYLRLVKNPVARGEQLSLSADGLNFETLQIQVVSMLGQILEIQTLTAGNAFDLIAPRVPGQYWIYVEGEKGRQVLPFVVY